MTRILPTHPTRRIYYAARPIEKIRFQILTDKAGLWWVQSINYMRPTPEIEKIGPLDTWSQGIRLVDITIRLSATKSINETTPRKDPTECP